MVRWLKRSRRAEATSHEPTWRERLAAERTAKAEANLLRTERRIHEIADEMRTDLKE
jgi:hypothetical protein